MQFEVSVKEMECPGRFVVSRVLIKIKCRCTRTPLVKVSNLSSEDLVLVIQRVKEIVFSYQSKHRQITITRIPAKSIYFSFVENYKMKVYFCEDYIIKSNINISLTSLEVDDLNEVLDNLLFDIALAVSSQNDDCSSSDIVLSSSPASLSTQRSF